MTEINDDVVFVAEPGNEISMVPDGCMIYQPSRERVHYLNPTAVVVYELCIEGRKLPEISAFLAQAYSLEAPPLPAVRECLDNLLKEGLILPCPPSPSAH